MMMAEFAGRLPMPATVEAVLAEMGEDAHWLAVLMAAQAREAHGRGGTIPATSLPALANAPVATDREHNPFR